MGTFKFHGEGGDSAQNAVGDTAAGNIWDTLMQETGATQRIRCWTITVHYTLPSMVDGLTGCFILLQEKRQ